MRDRAWRRYMEEVVVMRRLKRLNYHFSWHYRPFTDINGVKHRAPIAQDFIGSYDNFTYKTHTTKRNTTRHKDKYSPNKSQRRWRTKGSTKSREGQKKIFRKILKENGLI